MLTLKFMSIDAFAPLPFPMHLRVHQTLQPYNPSTIICANLQLAMVTNDDLDTIQQAAELSEWLSKASIILVAGSLGILSQTLINSMLKGDQGLSAFLSDGKGYGNSKFRPRKGNDESAPLGGNDPLPWLKLPQLSYVEVAGQEKNVSEEVVVAKLEELSAKGRAELEAGQKDQAAATMLELNALMEEYGFEFKEGR